MTENKLKNFELYFVVELVKADNREFRQDSDQLLPDNTLKVCVLLPRENEYVHNLSEISKNELSGEIAPEPVLTPKGFAYIKMELEKGFEVPKLTVTEDEWVETEKKLNPAKIETKDEWTDPDWGNTTDKLKPDVETWEDEKETWE